MSAKVNLSPADATSRVNIATFFDTSKTIINVTPTGQWVITPGQPATAPNVTANPLPEDSAFTIEFEAGREGSSDVAQQFTNLCGGADHMWGIGASFDSTPSELNFYFGLVLQLQGVPGQLTIYLAQGSVVSNNGWKRRFPGPDRLSVDRGLPEAEGPIRNRSSTRWECCRTKRRCPTCDPRHHKG